MLTVGGLTMMVKAMGFGKDLVVAGKFGTADALDAFLMAYLIPSATATVFSGALDALIPAHAEAQETKSESAAHRLAANGLWVYAGGLAVVFTLLFFCCGGLIPMLVPKFSPEKQALTGELLRQLLPFGWLYGVALYFVAWLQANRRFFISALAPAAIPLCSILFLFFGPSQLGVSNLVTGSLVGGFLLCVILLVSVLRLGYGGIQPCRVGDGATPRMIRDSLPLLAGGLLTSGLPLVDTTMASYLDQGSVSVLSYSEKICGIVLALLGTSVGQALYPFLASQAAKKDWVGLRSRIVKCSGLIAASSIPIVLGIWLTAPWIVSILFQHGAFEAHDSTRVAEVLRYQAAQIPFYIAAVLASHVVSSLRAGNYMLFTTVVNLAMNIGLNLLLMRIFGLKGIALATTGVYAISALMLYQYIFREIRRRQAIPASSPA
jgi:putative peptidoglycan lipid II flippase